MDDQTSKSCWGLTTKVVVVMAVMMLLTWFVGGSETGAVMATTG